MKPREPDQKAANSEAARPFLPGRGDAGAAEPQAQDGTAADPRDLADAEDQRLVARARDGDEAAFAALFEKYREPVYRVLYGVLRHREDALEATQEVFIKMHRALPRYDPRARFFTWLYRIAVHQGIDGTRRRRTRREVQTGEHEPWEERDGGRGALIERPAEWAEQRERIAGIEAALAQLPEGHRQVLVLFAREGLSYGEIAEVLEIPQGTVMSRLFYARQRLRSLLPPEWSS